MWFWIRFIHTCLHSFSAVLSSYRAEKKKNSTVFVYCCLTTLQSHQSLANNPIELCNVCTQQLSKATEENETQKRERAKVHTFCETIRCKINSFTQYRVLAINMRKINTDRKKTFNRLIWKIKIQHVEFFSLKSLDAFIMTLMKFRLNTLQKCLKKSDLKYSTNNNVSHQENWKVILPQTQLK